MPARRGRENKLISLTQPAVTPPQHDINPKPRLSLFKLYESLRRRIGGREGREGENFVGGSIPLVSRSLFASLFRSYIPSLVAYKQERIYTVPKEGENFSLSLRYFYSGIF